MYRRIRDLREDGDLLQRDLAGYLGIAQTTYSNYEIGEREIPISVLIRLADYYHTSVDYLLGLTSVRKPYPRDKEPDPPAPEEPSAP